MSTNEMLAVMVDKERVMHVRPTEKPACSPYEVLVRVRCIGVCGTDLHLYQGLQNHRVTFPIIPGHEWSGEVEAVGENVSEFTIGQRVVGEVTIPCGKCVNCRKGNYNICPKRVENGVFGRNGAAAEYIVVPSYALHPFSPNLSFEEACLIEPTAVAYRSIEKVRVTPADHVLVVGAGPIGLLTTAMAKAFGASSVTLVDLRQNRLDVGKRLGADHTINLSADNYTAKALEVTGGELFNVIIEASGSASAFESLFEVTAPGARVCLVGIFERRAEIEANIIVRKDLEIYGSVSSPNVWKQAIQMVEQQKIPVREIITHEYELKDFEIPLLQMETRDPHIIKAIVRPPSTSGV
ncbi:zinc-dependent alcohol dehydrogenase [Paenibacillus radicis (ex Xue et al. 2023)]|uniref:Alcohol dehydrogenase catalytic domain-containing protein n=1 Tax=Paenibacillus radicis (ex Xue et al. 2023) TaxID=2972489 RepID=A0ABT1YLX4_9BACL|nr:alcohol dehydrogenase catalytic domain-containing protein [Paenibacillus radicis (ex Xue et al. 2023)]MCR8634195.1 alcohol dehydrogenase catalytic domain-containing protein [Paenibacillus radicis (ex Xue et al. 2023)]